MKHAVWLLILERLLRDEEALCVVDTHAGAGAYDLAGDMARRSNEAAGGWGRLLDDQDPPPGLKALKEAVTSASRGEGFFYPGSPLLTLGRLRPRDALHAFELRPEDHAALARALGPGGGRKPARYAHAADGYDAASALSAAPPRRAYLVDPPYERGDEAACVAGLVRRSLETGERAGFAVWAPLKDLESLDALTRRLEALRPASLVLVETRLRPPLDPMRLNGSAMLLVNLPDVDAEALAAARWAAGGEASGSARLRRLT